MFVESGRVLLANMINDVMIERPPINYLKSMAAVTPRKLWMAQPGDCLVTLAPCSRLFRKYVADMLELDFSEVEILAPPEIRLIHALDVVAELEALDRVIARDYLLPFVLDKPVQEFSQRTGMRILPYVETPNDAVLNTVSTINTKSGFRDIAKGLDLPIAEGGYAENSAALSKQLARFLVRRPAAIVKRNRASNGCGNVVVWAGDTESLEHQVGVFTVGLEELKCGWVYEEFLPFDAVPSMEMIIGDGGVEEFYSCDQRSVNNSWTGMVTPAKTTSILSDMWMAAAEIGRYLHNCGYRGIFDVDCGVMGSKYVVTEANVRRTGGTYLEELARRLLCVESGQAIPWRADAKQGRTDWDFDVAAREIDLAGLNNRGGSGARAVLTADTLAVDGKWRYLVFGDSSNDVAEAESLLCGVLGIDQ